MNTALYQELIDPSRFNYIAAITLVVLIFLCLLLVSLAVLRKPQDNINSQTKGKKRSKGF